MTKNIEYFNTVVGIVFDELYAKFPITVKLDEAKIAKTMGATVTDQSPINWPEDEPRLIDYGKLTENIPFEILLWSTVNWLHDEGFVRHLADVKSEITLTSKALSVLNATPEAFDKPTGARLNELAKNAGSEAGRQAIGETVGYIIGAVAKGIIN